MQAAEKPFKEFWASELHPFIKDDLERLLNTPPKRIADKQQKHQAEKAEKEKEKADKKKASGSQQAAPPRKNRCPVREKLQQVCEEVNDKGERRNAYMNLTYTAPNDNSYLAEKISLGKVENCAADMFFKSLATDGAAETAPDSVDGADDADTLPQKNAERRAVEILSEKARKPWRIPTMVERGYEIPIMASKLCPELELGRFKRLGMDVVVNAVWLAYYWAKKKNAPQRLQHNSRC